MKYKVVIAGYVICRSDIMDTLPSIPGTEQVHFFDENSEGYRIVWDGYIQMREQQKTKPLANDNWAKVKVPENGEHKSQFREALNIFMRFLAGEGRDNCNQVKTIELCDEEALLRA